MGIIANLSFNAIFVTLLLYPLLVFSAPVITSINLFQGNPTPPSPAPAHSLTIGGSGFGTGAQPGVGGVYPTNPTLYVWANPNNVSTFTDTASVTCSHTGTDGCYIKSDSQIICRNCAGDRGSSNLFISISGVNTTVPFPFTYDAPVVTGTSTVSPVPTRGGLVLTVSGRNFGRASLGNATTDDPDVDVIINDNVFCVHGGPLDVYVRVISDSVIICSSTPAGTGKQLGVSVIVATLVSNTQASIFQYAVPTIASITTTNLPDGELNTDSSTIHYFVGDETFDYLPAGQPVTVTGTNFGNPGTAVSAPYAFDTQLPCTNCTIQVTQSPDPEVLVCYDCPVLFSQTQEFILEVGPSSDSNFEFCQTSSPYSISYVAPTVTCVNSNVDGAEDGCINHGVDPPTSGGTWTIDGYNFGPVGAVPVVWINYAGDTSQTDYYCDSCATSPPGNREMVCTGCPGGVGAGNTLFVLVDIQTSKADGYQFAFGAPVVTSYSDSGNIPADGSGITILGFNFGPEVAADQADSPVVCISPTPIQCNSSAPADTLCQHCSVPSWGEQYDVICSGCPLGVGQAYASVSLASISKSQSPVNFTYAAPIVSTTGDIESETSGSFVSIGGIYFGPSGTQVFVNIGPRGMSWEDRESAGIYDCTSATLTDPNDAIGCTAPPGIGSGDLNTILVNIAGRSSNEYPYNYHAPVVSSFSPTRPDTLGGTIVTIYGGDFGVPTNPDPSQVEVVFGTGAESFNDRVGDNKRCTGSPNNQTDVHPAFLYSQGGGSYMIVCYAPEGEGDNNNVIVKVADLYSDVSTSTFTYAGPCVTAISPNGVAEPTGGSTVTLFGYNFGIVSGGSITATIDGNDCSSAHVVHDHDTIICTVPAGRGGNLDVNVTVVGVVESCNFTGFNYITPTITSVTDQSGNARPDTDGGVFMISGYDFGTESTAQTYTDSEISVTVYPPGGSPSSCSGCYIVDPGQHEVLCSGCPSGFGVNNITLTVDTLLSNTFIFTYVGPKVSFVSPNPPETYIDTRGSTLSIHGKNFGNAGSPLTVRFGTTDTDPHTGRTAGTACLDTITSSTVVSATNTNVILCNVPPGTGAGKNVVVWTSDDVSNTDKTFSYAAPIISSIYADETTSDHPLPIGDQVTIHGNFFGEANNAVTSVYIQDTPSNDPISSCFVQDQNTIYCPNFNEGVAVQTLIVTVDSQTDTLVFTYASPTITAILPATTTPTSGGLITIFGVNFGPLGSEVDIVFHKGTNAEAPCTQVICNGTNTAICDNQSGSYTKAKDNNHIYCMAPSGFGLSNTVDLSVVQTTTVAAPEWTTFGYAAPVISHVNFANGVDGPVSTTNGFITLTGVDFGTTYTGPDTSYATTITATIGGSSPCTCAIQTAHTGLICSGCPNSDGCSTVELTVASQDSNTYAFTYVGPTIDHINYGAEISADGERITLIGSGFGVSGNPVGVWIYPPFASISHQETSSYACAPISGGQLMSVSDTEIICNAPPGVSKNDTVIVKNPITGSCQQQSLPFSPIAYAAPIISVVTPINPPPSTTSLSFVGDNFFHGTLPDYFPYLGFLDGNQCGSCVGKNSSLVVCDCGTNIAESNFILMIDDQNSTQYTFTYAAPVITGYVPATSTPTTGGVVTIKGYNFGASGTDSVVTIAPTGLTDQQREDNWQCSSAITIDDNTISCSAPPGTGYTHTIKVKSVKTSSNTITSSAYTSFTYAAPTITDYTPSSPASALIHTPGGVTISIEGENFGPAGTTALVSIAPPSSPQATCTNPVVVNDTLITCVAPAGTGNNNRINVTIDGLSGTADIFDYHSPTVTYVSIPSDDTKQPGPRSNVDTIFWGEDFGNANLGNVDSNIHIYLAQTDTYPTSPDSSQCTSCKIITADHKIECTCDAPFPHPWVFADVYSSESAYGYQFDYQAPVITAASPNDGTVPTEGGRLVSILGYNFGPNTNWGQTSPVITFGQRNCTAIVWSDIVATCASAPPGLGNEPLFITIASIGSAEFDYFEYAGPIVTGSSQPPAVGGPFTVFGPFFGETAPSAISIFIDGKDACPNSAVWIDTYTAYCPSINAGTGSDHDVVVNLDAASTPSPPASNAYTIMRYQPPIIYSVDPGPYGYMPQNWGTGVGGPIKLTGVNFGPADFFKPVFVTVNYELCQNCMVTTDDTVIKCSSCPVGTGPSLFLTVIVDGQHSPLNNATFNYAPPVVTSTNPVSSTPTPGGSQVTILGSNFGPTTYPVSYDLILHKSRSLTEFAYSHWLPVHLKYGKLKIGGFTSANLSYAYETVYIPPSSALQIAFTLDSTCSDSTHTSYHIYTRDSTTLATIDSLLGPTCNNHNNYNFTVTPTLSPYLARNVDIVFSVTQTGTTSNPAVISISNIHVFVNLTNSDHHRSVSIYNKRCHAVSWSPEAIVCIAPEGVGLFNNIDVQVDGIHNYVPGSYTNFGYGAPTITSVSRPFDGVPTQGGIVITLNGNNFGPVVGNEGTLQVTVNNFPCTNIKMTIPHHQVYCTAPAGAGTHNPVRILVGQGMLATQTASNQWSQPYYLFYALPYITSCTPVGSSTQAPQITITGGNFGPSVLGGSRYVKVGNEYCEIDSISNTQIICTMPDGYHQNLSVVVHIQGAETAQKFQFSYPLPFPTSTIPAVLPTTPGFIFTVVGRNFGPAGTPITVTLGKYYKCPEAWVVVPHTMIAAKVPSGSGKINDVHVAFTSHHFFRGEDDDTLERNKRSVESEVVSEVQKAHKTRDADAGFDLPIIHSAHPNVSLPTLGGILITINGENFGPTHLPGNKTRHFYVGTAECTNVVMTKDQTQVVCTLPPGMGDQVLSTIVDGQSEENPSTIVEYHHPVVVSVTPNTGFKVGTKVTLLGGYFGSPVAYRKIRFGDGRCENIFFVSDSEIHCYITSGKGANQYLFFTQDSYFLDSSITVDYLEPFADNLLCFPPNGAQDKYERKMCNCWSGYAPENKELQIDCAVHANCPPLTTDGTGTGSTTPNTPVTSFSNDMLHISQSVPITQDRRGYNIHFEAPTENGESHGMYTCGYPGQIWRKSISTLDCLDKFDMYMPWTMSNLCGFVQDTNRTTSDTVYYKTIMVTSYTEVVMVDGDPVSRVISSNSLIVVSFVKETVSQAQTVFDVVIQDPTLKNSVELFVTGDTQYDPKSKNVYITFRTRTQWPYKISDNTLSGDWESTAFPALNPKPSVPSSASLSNPQPSDIQCSTNPGEACIQQWVATISVGTVTPCVSNIQGLFTFSGPLLCRDVNGETSCPSSLSVPFSIIVGKTDLCDPTTNLDASARSSYELISYNDFTLTDEVTAYQTGDTVYLAFVLTDPSGSIDSVTLSLLQLQTTNLHDSSTLVDTLYTSTSGATHAAVNCGFAIVKEASPNFPYPPNTPITLALGFSLFTNQLDTVQQVTLAPSGSIQITTRVAVDIHYHGNKKRSLVFDGRVAQAEKSLNLLVQMSKEDLVNKARDSNQEHGNTNILSNLLSDPEAELSHQFSEFEFSMSYASSLYTHISYFTLVIVAILSILFMAH